MRREGIKREDDPLHRNERAFLPYVEALELTNNAAISAQIQAALKKRGIMIGAKDLFIAHARAIGLTLITNTPPSLSESMAAR